MRELPEIQITMGPDSRHLLLQTLPLLISSAPPELLAYLRHRLLESVPPLRRLHHLRLLLRRDLKYAGARRPNQPDQLAGDTTIHQLEAPDPGHRFQNLRDGAATRRDQRPEVDLRRVPGRNLTREYGVREDEIGDAE